jgi:hypothetical protein
MLSDQIQRKFISVYSASDWEIETDSGWQDLVDVKQTEEYEVWQIRTHQGKNLKCADDHIVFTDDMAEIFVKNLSIGSKIQTNDGIEEVVYIAKHDYSEPMYDVEVNSPDHRFFSNGILSHNTTVAAGYLLWFAMFRPDSTVLVASKTYASAQEIMSRVRFGYELCPDHIRAGAVEYNKGSIVFDNGSRIVSATTTANTGRGMSLSLVYLDEFAFVPRRIAEEFWTSLRPTLATGGKCIITSTPNNDDDTFARIWQDSNKRFDDIGNITPIGINGFAPYIATWEVHPDRDQQWADGELVAMGREKFEREHLCRFISADETLVSPLKLAAADFKGTDPAYTLGQVRWYKRPSPAYKYAVALDPSTGTGGDPAAIQVIELPSMVQIAEWKHNKTPPEGQVRTLMDILQHIKESGAVEIYWTLENNAVGESALVCVRDTGEENFPGFFISDKSKRRKGFTTTNKSKVEACMDLKRLIERDRIHINSKPLMSELKTFVARGAGFAAKSGDTDDLVMALVTCLRLIKEISTYEEDVYAAFTSSLAMGYDEDEYDAPLPVAFL